MKRHKGGYVYFMMNRNNTVIYTGVTSDLKKRVYEHRHKLVDGLTKKYSITKLVYYESFDSIVNAIVREKQIKGGPRRKKLKLVQTSNPDHKDLYDEL